VSDSKAVPSRTRLKSFEKKLRLLPCPFYHLSTQKEVAIYKTESGQTSWDTKSAGIFILDFLASIISSYHGSYSAFQSVYFTAGLLHKKFGSMVNLLAITA
jgi:hypothetical protein